MNLTLNRISLLSAFAAGVSSCGTVVSEAEKQESPNFIVINLDDAGRGDFSHLGALGYKTPNIDSIATNGMQMTNFYSVQPISGASRGGLMTGCYPNRIGFSYASGPNSPTGIHQNEMTIAELLKQKDYATAIYGKWHLGDAKQFMPLQNGFDEYYGLPYSNDMWPFHPHAGAHYPKLPMIEGNDVVGYNTDQSQFTTDYTNRTVEFIKKNRDTPFFVYLAHSMPHVPLAVSNKFKGKSEQGLYGDVMMELDWSVGQVVRALEELGLADNTLIILTSDNGPWANYGNHAGSSGGLREAKATTFNGGLRVPFIAYWPGVIEKGESFNGLLSNIDIFPTIAELAGAALPEHTIDGVSFVDVLRDVSVETPREYLCMYFHLNSLEAITDGDYKLVFPHTYTTYNTHVPGVDGMPGGLGSAELTEPELYDLRRDPGERTNVISQHSDVYERLKSKADEYRHELGDDLTGIEGVGRREAGRVVKEKSDQ